MCFLCDNPEATPADYDRYLDDLIARFGWAITAVAPDRARAPLAYTIGLTRFDVPELVVTGLRADRASILLNQLAHHCHHSEVELLPGEQFELTGRECPPMPAYSIEVAAVPRPDAHLFDAARRYGPRVRALQLVWADDRGRWPWERGHRGGRGGQPVLGPRATLHRADGSA